MAPPQAPWQPLPSFDELRTNGLPAFDCRSFSTLQPSPPFALSLSKGERRYYANLTDISERLFSAGIRDQADSTAPERPRTGNRRMT
jgi:hypothetical protein